MCMYGFECGSLYVCVSLVHLMGVCVTMHLPEGQGALPKTSFPGAQVSSAKGLVCECSADRCAG